MAEFITIGGKKYRKFIRYPSEVKDGTCRCISCGQIDEYPWHDDKLCELERASQWGALSHPSGGDRHGE